MDAFERESADPERRESAVERYRADLVSCLDEPFLVAPRERLRARQLANLDFLILRERAAGDYASALRYAGRRRALDEWCEVTLRRNLVLRAESGDRSGALALYETFVRRLHEEVGARSIAELEAFPRGLYGGALGWIDSRGSGEFIVGLRSALIDGSRARMYAGAGIVAGSSPETEFAETELKFRAMQDALLGS